MDDFGVFMSRPDEGAGLVVLAAGAVIGAVSVCIALLLVWGLTASGPNCPGMDPEWIGWCQTQETAE